MSRKPSPSAVEQLPPLEVLLALIARLVKFATKDPVAKLILGELRHCQELYQKVIREVVDGLLASGDQSIPDPKAIEQKLKSQCRVLETMLNLEGRAQDVKNIHAQQSTALQVAQALVKLAHDQGGKTLLSEAEDVSQAAHELQMVQDRVAAGGHPLFEEVIAKAATRIWIGIDDGFDILGVCVRRSGATYDPVLATRPTTKTSLRPQLTLVPPAPASAKKAKKPAKAIKAVKKPEAAAAKSDSAPAPAAETTKG